MTVPINGVPTSCAVCWDLQTGKQYYAIPITPSVPGTIGGITPNIISYTPPGASSQAVAGEVGAKQRHFILSVTYIHRQQRQLLQDQPMNRSYYF